MGGDGALALTCLALLGHLGLGQVALPTAPCCSGMPKLIIITEVHSKSGQGPDLRFKRSGGTGFRASGTGIEAGGTGIRASGTGIWPKVVAWIDPNLPLNYRDHS